MTYEQTIINSIARLQELKVLVESYQTVATSTMRQIRSSVLSNRDFYEGLKNIFEDVRNLQSEKILAARKPVGEPRAPQKTVRVFLSANTGLYGEIVERIARRFADEARIDSASDRVVIGKIGQSLVEKFLPGMPFRSFEFPDIKINVARLQEVTHHLKSYDMVIIYHGKFINWVSQAPAASVLPWAYGEIMRDGVRSHVSYLVEPTLETLVVFFEVELFASLLEQTFHESWLAKLASRISVLDGAHVNIDRVLTKTLFDAKRARHRMFNQKQSDAVRSVWAEDSRNPMYI